jgi:transposase
VPYVAVVASISAERGLENRTTYNSALDRFDFAEYLQDISRSRDGRPFALFIDNARFHKAIVVKDQMAELGIRPIMNVPYSPQYNPIEGCFSIVKNHFKMHRLNAMLNDRDFNFQKGIDAAFKQLTRA